MTRAFGGRRPSARARIGAIALGSLLCVGSLARSEPREEPRHVFGGQTVGMTLPLVTVDAPEPVRVRTRLVQRASDLAAPLRETREIDISAGTSTASARDVQIQVEVPEVQRETTFELRAEWRAEGDGDWRLATPVVLVAHPRDLLAPLRRWAARRRLRVVEDPEAPRLGEFLESRGIAIERPGAAPRPGSGPPVTLYTGKAARPMSSGRPAPGTNVLFTEHADGLPHLVLEDRPDGSGLRLTVEMALLDRLESDPAAQRTLIQIFELLEARSDER